ncbi:MAG: glycosyltransferase family 2 protein [Acidobacteriota bacterium]|nr:glycosyltransferase family 2 protein [Acidobacteriota bacterium]
MMILCALAVFWTAFFLVFYTYFGYPIVLFVCYGLVQIKRDWRFLHDRRDRRRADVQDAGLPTVTLFFAAYNEEEHLEEKLSNTLALDYPPEKLQVVIVSDGSSDRTNEILRGVSDARIETVLREERGGKSAALAVAVERARHSIFVLSDASTMFALDALRKLVRHFADPATGAVCGALSFHCNEESGQTEGLYWKYETALRLMEARMGATLTPSGAIYAVRGEIYTPPSPDVLVDDILTLMSVRRAGYKVHYDPEAKAVDFPASSVAGEFRRRVRIAKGSFRALPELWRAPKTPFTSFAFFSHKLLRWVLPVLMLCVFAANFFLLQHRFYRVTLAAQLFVLLWAGLGYLFRQPLRRVRFSLVGYFLVAMNLAFLIGLLRSFGGNREVSWQRGQ